MQQNYERPRNGLVAIRVSSTKQGMDGDSPEAQREQGERFCGMHNVRVAKILAYMESASKEEQPMQDVIEYCKAHPGEIDVIIVKSIDRFTRGGSYHYDKLRRQLDELKVELIDIYGVVSSTKVNTLEHVGFKYRWSEYTPSRKSELLEAERANDELRDILSRMIGSEIRYAKLGYWVRRPPYGFTIEKVETPNGKRSILRPDPKEAPIVQRMFELRAEGTLNDDQIAAEVNNLGYQSRTRVVRDKHDRTKVKRIIGGKPMTAKLLRDYLSKTFYAGVNTERWTSGNPVKLKFDGLVSVDLFNRANRGKLHITLNEHDYDHPTVGRAPKNELRAKNNVYNPDFPYRRVVACPTCHHSLLGSASRGKLGKYYPAYHCTNHGHYFRIPKKDFDATIEEFVKGIQISPERLDEVLAAVLSVWEGKRVQAHQVEEHSANKREELEAQIRVIVDKMKLVSSETAIKYMEEDLVRIEQQIKDLENVSIMKKAEEPVDMPVVLTYVRYFMEHLSDLLLRTCNPLTKAEYFGVIFDKVPTYQEIVDGTQNASLVPDINQVFRLASMQNVFMVGNEGLEPPTSSV